MKSQKNPLYNISLNFGKYKLTKVILTTFLIFIIFWLIGLALSPNKLAFIHDKSWLFQIFWFPLHLILGYSSFYIYKRTTQSVSHQDLNLNFLLKDIKINFVTYLIIIVLIAPFIYEDSMEAKDIFDKNFANLGYSSLLMFGPIWIIEWLMLGVIWTHIISTATYTIKICSNAYIKKNLNSILIFDKENHFLKAGVDNALISFIYGISSILYILFTGGESSDFQTTIISVILVFVCFMTSFLLIRNRLESALEEIVTEYLLTIKLFYTDPQTLNSLTVGRNLRAEELDKLLFPNANNLSHRAKERILTVKTALLINSITYNSNYSVADSKDGLSIQDSLKLIQYITYEINYGNFGMDEFYRIITRSGSSLYIIYQHWGDISKAFKGLI
jgi:hypothetical protein